MSKFLIDENLSPLLARDLRELGFSAEAVRDLGLKGKNDNQIINFAKRNKYIVITADVEFGDFFYTHLGVVSIVILQSRSQGRKSFTEILTNLRQAGVLRTMQSSGALLVAREGSYRVRKFTE